jgi:hypothetical protein
MPVCDHYVGNLDHYSFCCYWEVSCTFALSLSSSSISSIAIVFHTEKVRGETDVDLAIPCVCWITTNLIKPDAAAAKRSHGLCR